MVDMEKKLVLRPENLPAITALPRQGLSKERVEELLNEYKLLDDADIERGRISGTVYGMDPQVRRVILSAYSKYLYSNPLHPDVFKSVRKMEAEVVAMTLNMFNGDGDCAGTMTSGGTESILLACKAYRDRARVEKGTIFPEIIAPVTVHAAFEKAAQYFGIRLVHVPVDPKTGAATADHMKRELTPNTIALIASAPCFSLGVMDDVRGIADLALENDIACHVDCCLGSFILPQLAKMSRENITPFDFTIPGVTSISCDSHKYGFAPKGGSIIMYRGKGIRQYQYFVSTEWSGGIYATPTILGSRPGALVAATWATMMNVGDDGYRQAASQIALVADRIYDAITGIEGLITYGKPVSSVVAFGSHVLNIYAINDEMSRRGWHLNALQNPPAVHIACTMLTREDTVSEFVEDLVESVEAVRAQPLLSLGSGTAAIYGTSAMLPDKSIIEDVAKGYVDLLYKL